MVTLDFDLVPGAVVRVQSHPEWGLGHVQSVIANKVTVNFEHIGKQVIDAVICPLLVLESPL